MVTDSPSARPKREFLLEDPAWAARRARRRRWLAWSAVGTVVVVALGVTGSVVIRERARHAAARMQVTRDLQRLAAAQVDFHRATGRFGSLEDLGIRFVPSQGVRVRVGRADSAGWLARGVHGRVDVVCSIEGTDTVRPVECH